MKLANDLRMTHTIRNDNAQICVMNEADSCHSWVGFRNRLRSIRNPRSPDSVWFRFSGATFCVLQCAIQWYRRPDFRNRPWNMLRTVLICSLLLLGAYSLLWGSTPTGNFRKKFESVLVWGVNKNINSLFWCQGPTAHFYMQFVPFTKSPPPHSSAYELAGERFHQRNFINLEY